MNKTHNKKAFSLIEALIILLLISIAVMVLIPLISKKTLTARWVPIKNDAGTTIEALAYGTTPYERVGIGGVNPYQAETEVGGVVIPSTEAKFAARSIAVAKNNNNSQAITFGSHFENNAYSAMTFPASSIAIGVNLDNSSTAGARCNNATGGIILLSASGENDICNKSIEIDGHQTQLQVYIGNEKTKFVANKNTGGTNGDYTGIYTDSGNRPEPLIKLNGNKFTIRYPDNTIAMKYPDPGVDANLLLTENTSVFIGRDKTNLKRLYLDKNIQGYDNADIFYGDDALKCDNFVREESGTTYCTDSEKGHNATYGVWQLSDKRLKNIISDYKKGINEIDKLQTYRFTFKNDKKQEIKIGVIAQKLKGIFDEALHVDSKGFYSYEKSSILYAMVNSVKSISSKQDDISQKQQQMNNEADELIRKYK